MSKLGDFASSPCELLKYSLHSASVSHQNYDLILLKKKNIINENGIDKQAFLDIHNNFDSYLTQYEDFEFTEERKILLFFDYLNYCNFLSTKPNWRALKGFAKNYRMRKTSEALLRLKYESSRRREFRSKKS
jgi:hypothetical protein